MVYSFTPFVETLVQVGLLIGDAFQISKME